MPNVKVIDPVKIVERGERTYVLPHSTKHNGPIDVLENAAYVVLEGGMVVGGSLVTRVV